MIAFDAYRNWPFLETWKYGEKASLVTVIVHLIATGVGTVVVRAIV